jgi:hypothetical protein
MPRHLRLTLDTGDATATLISMVRRFTGKPISEIRQAILGRGPIWEASPHHNEYSEVVPRFLAFLDDLEAAGATYVLEIDGRPEPTQYLRNINQSRTETIADLEMMSDLESGEPCIETLQLLSKKSKEVFHTTLQQIVDGDGYSCSNETVDWARLQLALKSQG